MNSRSWEPEENITQVAIDAFESGLKFRQRKRR